MSAAAGTKAPLYLSQCLSNFLKARADVDSVRERSVRDAEDARSQARLAGRQELATRADRPRGGRAADPEKRYTSAVANVIKRHKTEAVRFSIRNISEAPGDTFADTICIYIRVEGVGEEGQIW
jgi:hypothetical protein